MKRASKVTDSTKELTDLAQRACLIAKDAAFNVKDFIINSSNIAYIAITQCEKELDQIERQIDESIPAAITQVTESEARQLLACLKFIIDLERIGDLLWSASQRLHDLTEPLPQADKRSFVEMSEVLQRMLEQVYKSFTTRDVVLANSVLENDTSVDRLCHQVFRRYLNDTSGRRSADGMNILLTAQAFERAGDHSKNLAEEVFHLVQGHSLRHRTRRKPEQR